MVTRASLQLRAIFPAAIALLTLTGCSSCALPTCGADGSICDQYATCLPLPTDGGASDGGAESADGGALFSDGGSTTPDSTAMTCVCNPGYRGDGLLCEPAPDGGEDAGPGNRYVVTTLAGNGVAGDLLGSGGPAGTAEFSSPSGVAVDAAGNVYVADTRNNRICLIDPRGQVTTLAGNGVAGDVDGTAGTAELSQPRGVAVDSHGNVYVADTGNNSIRKIDSSGKVTTFAGNGTVGNQDGTGGRAGSAELWQPRGIAVDSEGDVYVADTSNNRVCRIDLQGNLTTLAGNGTMGAIDGTGGRDGTAELAQPGGVAVNAQGDVIVADTANNRIRKIDPAGAVTTLAGNGQAGDTDGTGSAAGTALFDRPLGVAADSQGNVSVADSVSNRIRTIDSAGNVTTLAGIGPATGADGGLFADGPAGVNGTAEFDLPAGVAVDAQDDVYVADEGNNRIRWIVH